MHFELLYLNSICIKQMNQFYILKNVYLQCVVDL
jgi:hypothetical protein